MDEDAAGVIVQAIHTLTQGTRGDLMRSIESTTHRQLRNADLDCHGTRVRVGVISRTYYVKQPVTQAALGSLPGAELDNAILVRMGRSRAAGCSP